MEKIQFTVTEARTNLSALVGRAAAGDTIAIGSHGGVDATLVSPQALKPLGTDSVVPLTCLATAAGLHFGARTRRDNPDGDYLHPGDDFGRSLTWFVRVGATTAAQELVIAFVEALNRGIERDDPRYASWQEFLKHIPLSIPSDSFRRRGLPEFLAGPLSDRLSYEFGS